MQVTNLFNSSSVNFTSRSNRNVNQNNPYVNCRQTTLLDRNNNDQVLFTSKKHKDPLDKKDIAEFARQIVSGDIEPHNLEALRLKPKTIKKIKNAAKVAYMKAIKKDNPDIVSEMIKCLSDSSNQDNLIIIQALRDPVVIKGEKKEVSKALITYLGDIFEDKQNYGMRRGAAIREETILSLVTVDPKKGKALYGKLLSLSPTRFKGERDFLEYSPDLKKEIIMNKLEKILGSENFHMHSNCPNKEEIAKLIRTICPK